MLNILSLICKDNKNKDTISLTQDVEKPFDYRFINFNNNPFLALKMPTPAEVGSLCLHLHLPLYQRSVKADAFYTALGTVDVVVLGDVVGDFALEGKFNGSALFAV